MNQQDLYDEDVNENVFFLTLQSGYGDVYESSTTSRHTICVPRLTSLSNSQFERRDFESHILQECTRAEPTLSTEYHTLNNKHVTISNGVIKTGKGFTEARSVRILFEETFFNKNEESYQVLCIEQPLEGATANDVDVDQNKITLHYLTDCEDLLWRRRGDEKMGANLSHFHAEFAATLKATKDYSFQQCLDVSRSYYQKGLALLLKDKSLKKQFQKDENFSDSLKLALESYLLHKVYKPLFACLCTSVAAKDARLNKITRNNKALQLKELDVRSEYCQNVPRARKEIVNLQRYTTPMGKLVCLRRVFRVLMRSSQNQHASLPLTSDDLLPIVVFLVIKCDIAHWWATFRYMTDFRFAHKNQADEYGYFLATLEAALEHISSKQFPMYLRHYHQSRSASQETDGLFGTATSRSNLALFQHDATKSRSALFFLYIRHNDIKALQSLMTTKFSPKALDVELCHPLCDCGRCKLSAARQEEIREDDVISLETLDDRGQTGLHVAAGLAHTHIIDWLISQGQDVNVKDVQGQTALHVACAKGKQSSSLLLLHYKALPNIQDNEGNTALHLAALNCHEDCLKALIYFDQCAHVIDTNIANDFGDRPLHLASKWGFYKICQLLLENGASIEVCNRKHLTPCDVAHNLRVLSLLKRSTDVMADALLRRASTPAKMIITSPDDNVANCATSPTTTPRNSRYRSSLPSAADARLNNTTVGDFAGTAIVIDQATSPTSRDAEVNKLLRAVFDRDLQLIKYVLGWNSETGSESSSSPSSSPDPVTLCHPLCQCDKCAPLQRHTTPKRASTVHVNSQNAEGHCPLHVAAQNGYTELVKLLLHKGALVNMTNNSGVTTLLLALKNQHTDTVQAIMKYRPDVTIADCRGNTPLHMAALYGNEKAVALLVQHRANVNVQNSRGNTPLHECARAGHVRVTQLLVTHNADVTLVNKHGHRAVDLAQRDEVTFFLRHAQAIQRKQVKAQSFDVASTSSASPADGD